MKRLIFISLFVALLSSCGNKEEYGRDIYRRSFAMWFYETGGIELTTYPDVDKKNIFFKIVKGHSLGSYNDTGEKKKAYDALCEKYGDMSYKREVFVPIGAEPGFMAYSPVSVDIVSDADYDEKHPAGTSLAELVIFDSDSSKLYIDSGYVEYDWGDGNALLWPDRVGKRPYYPVYKTVSNLNNDDLMLLYSCSGRARGSFYFETLPTLSQTHNITVTFTDERGKTFSDTIEMNFE